MHARNIAVFCDCVKNKCEISKIFVKFSIHMKVFTLSRKIEKFYEISYKNKPFVTKLENLSILMTKLQKLLKIFQKNYAKFCYIFMKTVPFLRKTVKVEPLRDFICT